MLTDMYVQVRLHGDGGGSLEKLSVDRRSGGAGKAKASVVQLRWPTRALDGLRRRQLALPRVRLLSPATSAHK